MPTIQLAPAANADDAQERQDGTSFTAGGATLTVTNQTIDGARQHVGVRFPNCTVPKGATITAATLQVVVGVIDDPDGCDIFGNAVDNAANFTDEADVTSRAVTSATVDWPGVNIGSGTKFSPDISTIVQEIVNRSGWVAGNAICIIVKGRNTAVIRSIAFDPFDATGTDYPRLNITYIDPGGGSSGGQGNNNANRGNGVGGGQGGGKENNRGQDKSKPGGIPGVDRDILVGSRSRRRLGVL